MSVTSSSFRQVFNEFRDPDIYSDFAITTFTTVALNLLDPVRWGDMLDYGTMLYVAHRLVLARRDSLTSSVGGVPGATGGVLTSKSVDSVAASYDTSATTHEGAGQYNLTRYGVELWGYMMDFGSGGVQMMSSTLPRDFGWDGGLF